MHFTALGHNVTVWSRSVSVPPNGCQSATGSDIPDTDIFIFATPAQTTRTVLTGFKDKIRPNAKCVITAKGVEKGTLCLQSEVMSEIRNDLTQFVLTGPSFAADVSQGKPTALTLAGSDSLECNALRDQFSGNGIRVYSSDDIIGAQIGGALKNVIAIACGIVAGLDLGASAQAALMTRGFAELARLGVAMGGQLETLSGLSGLGDLTLTCHSAESRNYSYGYSIGRTKSAPETGTFEGAKTAAAALELAKRHSVEMPITQAVATIVERPDQMAEIIHDLLNRPLRQEDL